MDFFMKSEQYHGFELPEYFTFDEVLKYVRETIGNTASAITQERMHPISCTFTCLMVQQLSWHCNKYQMMYYYPEIDCEWDGQVCMTMEKILNYIHNRYNIGFMTAINNAA